MKKIFSCLCAVILLLQLVAVGSSSHIYAAGNATITVSTVTAYSGDENVEVTVTVADNPGICGMLLHFAYDPALTLIDVEKGEALSSLTLADFATPYLNPLNASWDGVNDDDSNGVVLKLTFALPADIQNGTYPIQVSYDYGNVFDGDLNDLELNLIQGAVMVEPSLVHIHKGGEATCKAQAVCSGCGESYGELNAKNHKGQTEIRGAVKESCETNGYTGDAWCLDCETKLITGTVIPAAHLWGEWVINEDGAVRECKNCDQKETHTVEKVEVPVVDEKQEESVSVNIIKTEEKVEVVLDQEELETKLENLVQENTQTTGVIVVDVAALTQVLEEVEVLNHVSIPTAAFTKLEEAAESSSVNAIEVQLTDGAVKFADEALSALSGTEGSSVDVDLSKIEEDVETVLEEQIGANPEKQTALETLKTEATILSAVSVTVVDASTREEIHDFTGNAEQTKANVTIAIAFELGSYKSEGLRVYYLTENGEREEYIPTYSDGKLFIEVPHLSTFIVGYNEAATPVYPLGDANHDGKADSSDAVAILRNLAGYEVPNFYEDTADFNGDGKADSSDAVAILRKLAGY